ncbi:restriction endonuclease subunit S [Fusicatenibacter saccharivorans]|uniref:restriction endonuclease subunit S n=1 Tax=Fusicatenibacter saccharivorans TaxID=1150298 RepID=UPI001EE09E11|nr:restriction endonuclease subunit S [Fusicatenibacter saccharivorans]MCG4760901.1 restriction endonuclease subunit S [Fusicatenibacter saccharivorans]
MGKPKVRFKGYTDDWEQRKLKEIADKVSEKNKNNEFSEPFTNSAEQGIISQKDYFDREIVNNENLDGYYIVRNDDFIYNPRISVTAPVGPINRNRLGRNGVMSPLYTVFRTHDIDNLYLEFYFKTTKWHRFMKLNGDSGARFDRFTISSTQFMEMPIPYPTLDEQQKIGKYFDSLDHLITLHQRKCENAQKLKKYMLQKMFPKNGTNVPEIRFEGFKDAWEQRKLGEITELKSASRVHKDEWTSNGVPFYRSSDVMAAINGTENEKAFISEELYEKLSKVSGKLEEGDILVTGGGSVGNPYIVPDNKPLYTKDADLLWIKNKGKFHPYFLYEFFFSPTFRNYLGSISHVGTIAHYTITQLSDTPICLPSFEEQKKVGEYFQSLDHLITLHQHKCEELKNIKKFMLQNMFVQEK